MWIIICYLAANLNGAYILAKWKQGKDIRTLGSGTGGARNAGRILGKWAFVLTVCIDALKVIIPLSLLLTISAPPFVLALSILALITGHIWPVLLKGRGGKGVVVYLAALLMIEPLGILFIGLIALAVRLFSLPFTKIMIAAFGLPPLFIAGQGYLIIGSALIAGYMLVLIAHTFPVHPSLSTKEEHL